MFRRSGPPNPRKPICGVCNGPRQIVRVMRRAGEGDQKEDDPDYAIRICPQCDRPPGSPDRGNILSAP